MPDISSNLNLTPKSNETIDEFRPTIPNTSYKGSISAKNIANSGIVEIIQSVYNYDNNAKFFGDNVPEIPTSVSVRQNLENLGAVRGLLDNLAGDSGDLQTRALGDILENFLMFKSAPSEDEQDAIAEELADKIIENFSISANVTQNQAKKVSTIRNGELFPVEATKGINTDLLSVGEDNSSDATLNALNDFANDSERLSNSSPQELMTALVVSLLLILQKQREIQSENRKEVKMIASDMVKMTFAFKMKAAQETKKSTQTQAIGQMVSGAINVISGGVSIVAGIAGLRAGSSSTSSGTVDQHFTMSAETWNAIAQTVNALGRGLGEMATGISGYLASGHTYEASVAETNAGIAQGVGQSQSEMASTNQSNIRDTKQHMDALISFLQQLYRINYDTIMAQKSNI